MKQTEYLARIREFLHDPEGKIWTNEELSDMLASAADTYCEDTGIFRGNFNFLVDASGVFQLPPAYLALVAAWNDNGTVITQTESAGYDVITSDEYAAVIERYGAEVALLDALP